MSDPRNDNKDRWLSLAAIRRSIERLAYGIAHPDEELTRLQRLVRSAWALGAYAGGQLVRNNASLMAAGLAYRTLFSLIPVLVLSILVLRTFVQEQQVERVLTNLLDAVGLTELSVAVPVDAESTNPQDSTPQSAADAPQTEDVELNEWIRELIDNAQNYLESISFGSIAVVGVFVFMYAAISLFLQVEGCFNIIYQSRERRRISVRIVYSWALLTLGSVAITASVLLGSGALATALAELPNWLAWLRPIVQGLTNGIIAWVVLYTGYQLIPSTRVRRTPAATGALVGALLFEGGKTALVWFVREGTGGQVAIYGSLALVPLFLLWVYVTWLIVLFGLQIAHAMQTVTEDDFWLRKRAPNERLMDPLTAVALVRLVAQRFADGKTAAAQDLALAVHLPTETVSAVLSRLSDAGFLHRLYDEDPDSDDPPQFILAKPAESVGIAAMLDALHGRDEDRAAPIPSAVRLVRDRERVALEGLTLADVIEGPDAPSPTRGHNT